jgi:hypothetical protein
MGSIGLGVTPTESVGVFFTEGLCRDMTVYPVTVEIAQLAGGVEGERQRRV